MGARVADRQGRGGRLREAARAVRDQDVEVDPDADGHVVAPVAVEVARRGLARAAEPRALKADGRGEVARAVAGEHGEEVGVQAGDDEVEFAVAVEVAGRQPGGALARGEARRRAEPVRALTDDDLHLSAGRAGGGQIGPAVAVEIGRDGVEGQIAGRDALPDFEAGGRALGGARPRGSEAGKAGEQKRRREPAGG